VGLGPALADDPRVVGPLVVVAEPAQHALGPARVDREPFELVGHGQQHRHERLLVVRLDTQDVEADALGIARLVQQTVAFRLVEGFGDGIGVIGLSSNMTPP
jgi:hypothetical protein